VDVDAAGPAEGRATALLGVAIALDAWHQREQVVPVADRERQVRDLRVRHDGAEGAVVRVEQRARLLDGDDFVEGADLQGGVDARALADFERDDLRALLEARQRRLDLIAAVVGCSATVLVSRFVRVTVAPGNTAPPLSVTTPVRVARSTCAAATAGRPKASRAARRKSRFIEFSVMGSGVPKRYVTDLAVLRRRCNILVTRPTDILDPFGASRV
jgi:hypothetical protein